MGHLSGRADSMTIMDHTTDSPTPPGYGILNGQGRTGYVSPRPAHAAQVRRKLLDAAFMLEDARRIASQLRYDFTSEDWASMDRLAEQVSGLYESLRDRASAI